MDPTETLRVFWACYNNRDLDEAYDAAKNLAKWLARGGFAPNWSIGGRNKSEFLRAVKAIEKNRK